MSFKNARIKLEKEFNVKTNIYISGITSLFFMAIKQER